MYVKTLPSGSHWRHSEVLTLTLSVVPTDFLLRQESGCKPIFTQRVCCLVGPRLPLAQGPPAGRRTAKALHRARHTTEAPNRTMANDVPMDAQDGSQSLSTMLAQLMNQVNDMRADQASAREAMRTQIRVLQENVASLQGTPTTTPQSSTPPAPPRVVATPLGVAATPPAPPEVTIPPPSAPGHRGKT